MTFPIPWVMVFSVVSRIGRTQVSVSANILPINICFESTVGMSFSWWNTHFYCTLLRKNHDFSSNGFQNKTSFLFETSQPRISLFECWDESSSDHRDVPDALPLLPCPQDPGQPDYLLLYHSCVFSNFTQTRKVWNKLLNIRGILGYANQKKICIFSLYDYYVKWKERLAVSAVSAKKQ